jgi:hypothetical protein
VDVRYFVVDRDEQVRPVDKQALEDVWHGRRTSAALRQPLGDTLRVISVLCDEKLLPRLCFFMRLDLADGAITDESRLQAYEAATLHYKRRYDHPTARRQLSGWPADWLQQLAVVLDAPAAQLRRIAIGGPLLMSDLWGIPVEKILDYFEQADRAIEE